MSKNPVEEFLDDQEGIDKVAVDDLRGRQKREYELWQQWKQNGQKKEDFKPLIQSFRPLINSEANKWAYRQRDIPPAAIKAEFTNQFVRAMDTYDPNFGAKLNTHVTHQLRRAHRFVTTYQNPGRIPETRVYRIRELQDAESYLDEIHGRPPTQHELSDYLKWSPRQVDTLQTEVRKARPTSQFEADPSSMSPSRHNEIMRLLPYDLNQDEKVVYEYLYGVNGKPKLSPGQIAKKTKMSAPKVSRLKRSIANKYKKHQ